MDLVAKQRKKELENALHDFRDPEFPDTHIHGVVQNLISGDPLEKMTSKYRINMYLNKQNRELAGLWEEARGQGAAGGFQGNMILPTNEGMAQRLKPRIERLQKAFDALCI